MSPLERQLAGAFEAAHSAARSELGFGMPLLLRMVAESGPTEAARRILIQASETSTKLLLRRRLDLSVEAIVLREEFRQLFDEDELCLASERLLASNGPVAGVEPDVDEDLAAWAQFARKARDQWASENPY